jgi:hypothetical protein
MISETRAWLSRLMSESQDSPNGTAEGIIVCGSTGVGKTFLLQNANCEMNEVLPDSMTRVSGQVIFDEAYHLPHGKFHWMEFYMQVLEQLTKSEPVFGMGSLSDGTLGTESDRVGDIDGVDNHPLTKLGAEHE